MGIVTKIGDKGTTRTLAGEEISKADERLAFTGAIDELNAHTGFARSLLKDAGLLDLAAELKRFQQALVRMAAESSLGWGTSYDDALSSEDVAAIEKRISEHEREVNLPSSFLIPGTVPSSAALEIARACARRVERQAVRMKECKHVTNHDVCLWVNRASDYLFILARIAEKRLGVEHDICADEVTP